MNKLKNKCHEIAAQSLSHGHLLNLDELLIEFDELDHDQRESIQNWYEDIFEFKYIMNLISEDKLEIHFHGNKSARIFSNNRGNQIKELDISKEDYQLSLEIMTLYYEQKWNNANPFVSFTFPYNKLQVRITLTHYCISATKTSKLFLRILQKPAFSFDNFNLNRAQRMFLEKCIEDKKNIVIAGPTGCGKTSFLKLLMGLIDKKEHLCILEDTHELYSDSPFYTHLLQNDEFSLTDYCAYALRMSPERIILGEIRSHEIVPFILAMNSGHRGLLSSVHSNNALDTLHRLSLLFSLFSNAKDLTYELVLSLICKNIDYIIYMKDKRVDEVIKVLSAEGAQVYFENVEEFKLESTSYTSIA